MINTASRATRPRNRLARLAGATVLWLLLWIPAGAVSRAITAPAEQLFPDNYPISDSVALLPYLVPLTALALVLPLVAYRRRDVLFAVIPFWNIIFTSIVCWRLAGLPHVDWPTRRS